MKDNFFHLWGKCYLKRWLRAREYLGLREAARHANKSRTRVQIRAILFHVSGSSSADTNLFRYICILPSAYRWRNKSSKQEEICWKKSAHLWRFKSSHTTQTTRRCLLAKCISMLPFCFCFTTDDVILFFLLKATIIVYNTTTTKAVLWSIKSRAYTFYRVREIISGENQNLDRLIKTSGTTAVFWSGRMWEVDWIADMREWWWIQCRRQVCACALVTIFLQLFSRARFLFEVRRPITWIPAVSLPNVPASDRQLPRLFIFNRLSQL